ncbi:conserved hypothetical protein [Luteimonas sp. 9C]|uniref:hypothetical protein n=1 Tax=Luteimonas sp. 9C TaxID=2653148 RepID=UPI0012F00BE0|nr:hypothetical protein [Luteimonas sp. 9C]VXA91768.1 conserved hypothetical protein [Luteimonas sp. 9C]
MSRIAHVPSDVDVPADATLHTLLVGALCLAAVALLSFPGLRTGVTAIGWPPLWLIGMPAVAWLTLFLRRLPRRRKLASSAVLRRRRPGLAQARRRPLPRRRGRISVRAALVAAGLLPLLR